jgi:hypothetical protein
MAGLPLRTEVGNGFPHSSGCESGVTEQVSKMRFKGTDWLQVLRSARVSVKNTCEPRDHIRGPIGNDHGLLYSSGLRHLKPHDPRPRPGRQRPRR